MHMSQVKKLEKGKPVNLQDMFVDGEDDSKD